MNEFIEPIVALWACGGLASALALYDEKKSNVWSSLVLGASWPITGILIGLYRLFSTEDSERKFWEGRLDT